MRVRRRERMCAVVHVLRREIVRHVHQRRVRADAEHHALHDADVDIGGAEIRQERDDRARHTVAGIPPALAAGSAGKIRRLAEEELAEIGLEEERIGDAEILEELDDVAILQDALTSARSRILAMPQRVFVKRPRTSCSAGPSWAAPC